MSMSMFMSMKSFFLYLIMCGLFLPIAHASDRLNVVTTTSDIASLTRTIGGNYVDVFSIVAANQDPHTIRAKPSFMRKVASADLFIRIGMELESAWENALLRGSRNGTVAIGSVGHLDLSTGIAPIGIPTGTIDRSMGDVHISGNPHYWLDPYNGIIMAREIKDRLSTLLPKHAAQFNENLDHFVSTLDNAMFGNDLMECLGHKTLWENYIAGSFITLIANTQKQDRVGGWVKKMGERKNVPIITFHKSWGYFMTRFNIQVVGYLEPKPGIAPNPAHLLKISNIIKQKHVPIMLLEPFYNRKIADFIASKTKAKVLVLPNAADNTAGGYIQMLDKLVAALSVPRKD